MSRGLGMIGYHLWLAIAEAAWHRKACLKMARDASFFAQDGARRRLMMNWEGPASERSGAGKFKNLKMVCVRLMPVCWYSQRLSR